jgi:hypothetical protein
MYAEMSKFFVFYEEVVELESRGPIIERRPTDYTETDN